MRYGDACCADSEGADLPHLRRLTKCASDCSGGCGRRPARTGPFLQRSFLSCNPSSARLEAAWEGLVPGESDDLSSRLEESGERRSMKRHRRRRDQEETPPLLRAWCEECQSFGFIIAGVRLCHERGPWEPVTSENEKASGARGCVWPECSEPARAGNAKWCVEHAVQARREAKLAYYHRTREMPLTRTSPGGVGEFLDPGAPHASGNGRGVRKRTVVAILGGVPG
jgi:hypothetical protein